MLELDELTILTAWAEAVSEAAAYAPERIDPLLAAARPGATWRAELGLPEPSPRLADAIESLGRVARAAPSPAGGSSFDALLSAAKRTTPAKQPSTKWSGGRCSPCSRSDGPGNQPKSVAHAEQSPARPSDVAFGSSKSRLGRPPKLVDRAGLSGPRCAGCPSPGGGRPSNNVGTSAKPSPAVRHCCLAVEAGLTTVAPRSPVLKDRDPAEDDDVWLVPCFFVHVGARRMGFTRALLTAAVEVAGEHCAKAVERFPHAAGPKVSADGFLGAEQVFAGCGFTVWPGP